MLQLQTTIGDDKLTIYKLGLGTDQNQSTVLAILDEYFFNRDLIKLADLLQTKKKLLDQITQIIYYKQSYLTFAKLLEYSKKQLIELYNDLNPQDEMNFMNTDLQIQRDVFKDKIIISLSQSQLEIQKQQHQFYKILKVSPYLCINCCSRHKQIFESTCGHSYCQDCHTRLNYYCLQKCAMPFCHSALRVGAENQQMLELQIFKENESLLNGYQSFLNGSKQVLNGISSLLNGNNNQKLQKVSCHVCGTQNEVYGELQKCSLCMEFLCLKERDQCLCTSFEQTDEKEPQFEIKDVKKKYKISDKQCQTCGNKPNNIIKVFQGQCEHNFCIYCLALKRNCKICYPNSQIKVEEKSITIQRPEKTYIEEQYYVQV